MCFATYFVNVQSLEVVCRGSETQLQVTLSQITIVTEETYIHDRCTEYPANRFTTSTYYRTDNL